VVEANVRHYQRLPGARRQVKISGFGNLSSIRSGRRKGRNPQTAMNISSAGKVLTSGQPNHEEES